MAARTVAGAGADRPLAEGNCPQQYLAPPVSRRPGGWEDFKTAYYAELEREPAQSAARDLLERLSREPVTLLFAVRDETHNNAVALKEWLDFAKLTGSSIAALVWVALSRNLQGE